MTDLFEMLTTIARRRNGDTASSFSSVRRLEKWLAKLPQGTEYDTHHALIEGMERFNAENEVASMDRLRVLLRLEEVGIPMQERIVDQYVRNQAAFRLARQSLWRESWMFWSLMAEAWLDFLKQANKGPAVDYLKPHLVMIAARALRYAGLAMRWDYHQGQAPGPSAWKRVHKIYRMVERKGHARDTVLLNGLPSTVAREYALVVLTGLVHPLGYRAQEIQKIAEILECYPALPLPEATLDKSEHTHVIDISLNCGAMVLDDHWMHGDRLRYLSLGGLIQHLQSLEKGDDDNPDFALPQQMASLIERGGLRRNRQRTNRFGRVWVTSGMDNILAALETGKPVIERPALEPWMVRDESPEGMGFNLPPDMEIPTGRLIATSWDPSENVWQLLVTRWCKNEDGQLQIGTQRLSRHPKRVEIYPETVDRSVAQEPTMGLFLPLANTDQGVSNLLLPAALYSKGAYLILRDADVAYRLRLGDVQETHESWVRVSMDVVGREQFAAAA